MPPRTPKPKGVKESDLPARLCVLALALIAGLEIGFFIYFIIL